MTHDNHDPLGRIRDERRRMTYLLASVQRYMTMLPDTGATPPQTGPIREVLRDLLLLAAFMVAAGVSAAAASAAGWVGGVAVIVAVYASLGATGQLRKMTVAHMHEVGGHGVGLDPWRTRGMSEQMVRRAGAVLADIASAIAVSSKSPERYRAEHEKHHDLGSLGTVIDPDGALVEGEGFTPGLAKGDFRRRLLARLLNPAWYARAALRRIVSAFVSGSLLRRVGSITVIAAIVGSAFVLPLPVWIAAIGLPWIVGYPAASLIQVLSEHSYGHRHGSDSLADYAARTWERVPWDIMPAKQGFAAWLRWGQRLLLIHLPSRLAFLDKTMIWHGYHHLAWEIGRPFDDWWNIHHHFAKAAADGVLPDGWQERVLFGVDAALKKQARGMETGEDA